MIVLGKIIAAIIATILFGYLGIIIGATLNLEGYLGVIFAIATMGAFFYIPLKVRSRTIPIY